MNTNQRTTKTNRFTHTFFTMLAALLSVGLLAGTASAKSVDLSKKAFKYSKIKYWRGKAENVRLGSYGEKKTNGKYLAVEAHMKAKHALGLTGGPIDGRRNGALRARRAFVLLFFRSSRCCMKRRTARSVLRA